MENGETSQGLSQGPWKTVNLEVLPTKQNRVLIRNIWDFPGGPVVKDPPSKAGDVGSIPGQGTKIPHEGQLSLGATTTELTRLN